MMRRERIVIIGAGAVGRALAVWARRSGHSIVGVVSRTRRSARSLASSVRARSYGTRATHLPSSATMVIIAVPDTVIGDIAADLRTGLSGLSHRVRVFHTSGSRTSDVLRPVAGPKVQVCSIHPIRSFPRVPAPRSIVRSGRGEWFGLEGRRADLTWARSFVRSLGGRAIVVPKSKKTLYHITCTFASNYPLVVMRAMELLAGKTGVREGMDPFTTLLGQSMLNALGLGPLQALTGPIVRGDGQTLRTHRAEIRRTAPHLVPLFDGLVSFATREAEKAKRVTKVQARSLRTALVRKKG